MPISFTFHRRAFNEAKMSKSSGDAQNEENAAKFVMPSKARNRDMMILSTLILHAYTNFIQINSPAFTYLLTIHLVHNRVQMPDHAHFDTGYQKYDITRSTT